MNDVSVLSSDQVEATEVAIVIERDTALSVLTDQVKFDAFYEKVKAETDKLVPDTTTAKGRDEIRSTARKVVRTKTAIVAAAKALTEDWRAQTAKVNESRNAIQERLDKLRDEVRRPLTEWEEAEEKREAQVKAAIDDIEGAAMVALEDTVETVQVRLQRIGGIEITEEQFKDLAPAAKAMQERTLEALRAAAARLRREAEERAELEQLRQANREREEREAAEAAERQRQQEQARRRRDHAESIMEHIRQCGLGVIGGKPEPYVILIRELQEKVVIDDTFGDLEAPARQLLADTISKVEAAHQAEITRREEEEAERRRRAQEETEQRARDEERRRAQEEQRQRDEAAALQKAVDDATARITQAGIIATDDTVESLTSRDAELTAMGLTAAKYGERTGELVRLAGNAQRAIREALGRLKAEADQRAQQEARQRDQEHRQACMTAAKGALMAAGGIGEEAAKKIVLAILGDQIPRVTLSF